MVTAGMPSGTSPQEALSSLLTWCRHGKLRPVIFGCEEPDKPYLHNWSLTEIGRQPLFRADHNFLPHLAGQDQPCEHRKVRRQARRALSKGIEVRELAPFELWELHEAGAFDVMLKHRWARRGLADLSFLVELCFSKGNQTRRIFAAFHNGEREPLGLLLLLPSQRGWLVEHQLITPHAPNGTAELLLCRLLSTFLPPGTWLSLGITPLYSELHGDPFSDEAPSILSRLPAWLTRLLLKTWESCYGFRSLLHFREKLEPEIWEPVYWAVPQRDEVRDTLAVLRAFAGGSLFNFGLGTLLKWLHKRSLALRAKVLPSLNTFYVLTLALWIPILWNLDGVKLFGSVLACKVWALYDVMLFFVFLLHHDVIIYNRRTHLTDILLGLVIADTVLAWIQTALFHGGLPSVQPLATILFLINSAPISAVFFLLMVRLANKPLPFQRRDLAPV